VGRVPRANLPSRPQVTGPEHLHLTAPRLGGKSPRRGAVWGGYRLEEMVVRADDDTSRRHHARRHAPAGPPSRLWL